MDAHRIFAALAVTLLLAGCSVAAPSPASSPVSPLAAPSPAGPFALTVVHSNDTWGYLDPCG